MSWFEQGSLWLLGLQRTVYGALGDRIRDMDGSADGVLAAACFALLLGTVHALTPGHGKAVVLSYFLGTRSNPWGGLRMAAKIAAAHVLSALVLVALFGSAASMFGRPSGVARSIQIASYAMILAVGLWLTYRSIREARGAPHTHHHGGDLSRGLLPVAVGLLPCPMTMLIMTYAAAHASILSGLVLSALLGVGIALTIAAVGTVGIALRKGVFARVDPAGRGFAVALNGLQIASSLAITLLGMVFLAGSLA